jgi:hypothetical protein
MATANGRGPHFVNHYTARSSGFQPDAEAGRAAQKMLPGASPGASR